MHVNGTEATCASVLALSAFETFDCSLLINTVQHPSHISLQVMHVHDFSPAKLILDCWCGAVWVSAAAYGQREVLPLLPGEAHLCGDPLLHGT